MKRLGLLSILLVGLSYFNGTTLVSAAISQSEFDSLRSAAISTNVKPFFEIPGSTTGQMKAIYGDRVLPTLNASGAEVFARIQDLPETTLTSARISLYTRWETDIFGIASSLDLIDQTRGDAFPLENARASLNAARLQAVVSQQVAGGSITPEQENAARREISTQQSRQIQQNVDVTNGAKCEIFKFSLIGCIDTLVTYLIKNTLLQIAGFLVWLTANMLNYAIQISILDFAKWAPDTLYPIWIIIRQIVSLAVVFAGLYLGFMYIIGREDTFGKYVGWLVLFALFVNFSYPVTRALVDVSNIISLNVYVSAVGTEPLSPTSTDTAGGLIMNKLGLQGLVASATSVATDQAVFVDKIKSTPGALIALVFVLYTAYIFFMATAIIAVRTAVLVFLIVASPLLLLDSVIPKLGDVAMKMRKMFFEQLAVAPVFMIMLALTLKFMDIFQTTGALGAVSAVALTGGADADIKVFFGILMMLIMLHIMLKVTKSLAGEAGNYATNMMGKVGGFGLGMAAGGAGVLARGTLGAQAARWRDSEWMDKLQGSRMGRGLYGLSNSLAQSTFDTRNIGMVNRGMASAGMGMGAGSTNNYDKNFAGKQERFTKKLSSIKDGTARQEYLEQTRSGARSRFGKVLVGKSDGELMTEKALRARKNTAEMYNAITDPAKKLAYYNEHRAEIDAWRQEQGNTSGGAASSLNLREQRLEKVAAGRAAQVTQAKENLQRSGDYLQTTRAYKDETNAIYDKELEELTKSTPNSLILGADGKPMKGTPSQAQIDEIEGRRAEMHGLLNEHVQGAARGAQESIGALEQAQRKQQQSAERASGTAASSTSGGAAASRYDSKEYEKPAFLRNPGTSAGAQAIHGGNSSSSTMSPAEIEAIKTKLKTEDFAGKMREKKADSGSAATV